jgi:hypothetical protein
MSAEELNARDMAIEEQLNFLSKQAAPKELANKPLKIKSDVTREMIEDFKAEQEGSVFHPPSVLPVLETFKPIAVPDKERVDEDKQALLSKIADYEFQIKLNLDSIPRIKNEYNENMIKLQTDLINFRTKAMRNARTAGSNAPELVREVEGIINDIQVTKQQLTEEFEREMADIDRKIAEIEAFKRVVETRLNYLDKSLSVSDELRQQNAGEKARVERVNRQAVKTFEDEINALNKGININQQPGESDADYLTRIENMKGARYGQEVAVQATTFNIKRFKTKMKEILTIPESALEIIIKTLERENMLYEANKKFPLIKAGIEKTYGLNPRFKADDADELHDFIINTLTKQFSGNEENLVVESQNADLLAKSKTGFIPKKDLLAIYEGMTGKKSFTGSSKLLAEEIIALRAKVIPPQDQAKLDIVARRQREAQDFLSRIGKESKEATTSQFGRPSRIPKVSAEIEYVNGKPTRVLTETFKTPEEVRLRYVPSGKDYVRPNLLTRLKEEEQQQRVGLGDIPTEPELKRTAKQARIGFKGFDEDLYASREQLRKKALKGLLAEQRELSRAEEEKEYTRLIEATLKEAAKPKRSQGRPLGSKGKKEVAKSLVEDIITGAIEKSEAKRPFAKGKGVERQFYPKLVPFGAIMISPAQLFYYKLLRVREPTKHSIRGMPDVRVSDDMVHILMKIINGGTPSMTELRALSEDEKAIYDAIIMKAKLHKEMPNTYEQSIASSISKLKKRLELCEGEWNAGNDNTKIKKELNSIIRQLTELKAITEVEGRNYLKQF